jgi:hypothetical protein
LGESANLAIGQFIRSRNLSDRALMRSRNLSDRALMHGVDAIGQFIRSGDRQICCRETALPCPQCPLLTKYTLQAVSVAKLHSAVSGKPFPYPLLNSHKFSLNTDLDIYQAQQLK